jgi:hypothetical protein
MPSEPLGCRKARGVKKLRRSDDLDAQQTPVRIEVQHDVAPAYQVHNDLFNGSTGGLTVRQTHGDRRRCGVTGTRTPNPCLAKAVLCQLSYDPWRLVVETSTTEYPLLT